MGTIERAFEIARSGTCESLPLLRAQLRQEKFERVDEHLAGTFTRDQLRKAMEQALAEKGQGSVTTAD